MENNGERYCELSALTARVIRLIRLLDEAHGVIDILTGRTHLNRRQKQVLELIAKGFSNKEIASELRIATKTVEFHRLSLMKVLRVHDAVRLTHVASKLGMIEL